jgi:multimeric flavodoxin WrbA
MIVILYDAECHMTQGIALRIKAGINQECQLMGIDTIDYGIINQASTIIFGCRTGFTPGVSYRMLRFMDRSYDRFANQLWKNKFAAGFTTDTGSNSTRVIEDICMFTAKHSMIWIPQGHLAENEGHNRPRGTRVNSNKSYLGCIASLEDNDLTAESFGRRISQQTERLLNPIQG